MTSRLPLYLSPRPIRTSLRRVVESPAAHDLRAELRLRGWTYLGLVLILLACLAVALLTRDTLPTWDGGVDLRPYRS